MKSVVLSRQKPQEKCLRDYTDSMVVEATRIHHHAVRRNAAAILGGAVVRVGCLLWGKSAPSRMCRLPTPES